MANLYDIDKKLLTLIDENFDSETGEILEGTDLEKAIGNTKMELAQKIENCVCYHKNLESDADAIDKEIERLQERKKSTERKAEWLKNYVANYMLATGQEKFETPKCKISFRKSTSVNIVDENAVPKEFKHEKVSISIDKNAIKDYLKNNPKLSVNGAELVTNKNIQIK